MLCPVLVPMPFCPNLCPVLALIRFRPSWCPLVGPPSFRHCRNTANNQACSTLAPILGRHCLGGRVGRLGIGPPLIVPTPSFLLKSKLRSVSHHTGWPTFAIATRCFLEWPLTEVADSPYLQMQVAQGNVSPVPNCYTQMQMSPSNVSPVPSFYHQPQVAPVNGTVVPDPTSVVEPR